MMRFDNSNTEIFTIDDTEFKFNTDRVQYIAEEQIVHINTRIKQFANDLKKKKNEESNTVALVALYEEWYVKDNVETLYLLFSEDNNDLFTDLTTWNDLYSNLTDYLT